MPLIQAMVFSMLCLSVGSDAAATCERNEYGVFEDKRCASAASKRADQELDEVYGELLESLDPAQREALVKSQHSWLAFVTAQTDLVFEVNGDGADGRLIATNERERLTRERASALRAWLPEK